jgi:hypothetical protein
MIDRRAQDFSGRDLAGEDFTDCDPTHSRFDGAKLAGAVRTGARLVGCHWEDADFVGADLSDSLLPELRLRVAGWLVSVRRDGTIKVGRCQVRTAEQWAEMGAADIAELTPEPDAPEDFIAERDAVLAASMALRGLY